MKILPQHSQSFYSSTLPGEGKVYLGKFCLEDLDFRTTCMLSPVFLSSVQEGWYGSNVTPSS